MCYGTGDVTCLIVQKKIPLIRLANSEEIWRWEWCLFWHPFHIKSSIFQAAGSRKQWTVGLQFWTSITPIQKTQETTCASQLIQLGLFKATSCNCRKLPVSSVKCFCHFKYFTHLSKRLFWKWNIRLTFYVQFVNGVFSSINCYRKSFFSRNQSLIPLLLKPLFIFYVARCKGASNIVTDSVLSAESISYLKSLDTVNST